VVGVEQWAEIRRMRRVEGLSGREISRRTGLHRDTVARLLAASMPPRYERKPAGSKLDPFKGWIDAQLTVDAGIESQRLREMACEIGYEGGKSIFDDYVREVRPRFVVPRTFQRTIYRPGELVQCDLWEPRERVPVGHGQKRRGWVVTCEVCWSRVIAGTLVFSKEAPDILWGLGRNLQRLGVLPEKLVWDRESAIAAGGRLLSAAEFEHCGAAVRGHGGVGYERRSNSLRVGLLGVLASKAAGSGGLGFVAR
jgi:transcriptional regulator with XRE-family HTH domain